MNQPRKGRALPACMSDSQNGIKSGKGHYVGWGDGVLLCSCLQQLSLVLALQPEMDTRIDCQPIVVILQGREGSILTGRPAVAAYRLWILHKPG